MYNPYAIGHQVYLRHPTIEDVNGPWHEWLSDEHTTHWLGMRYWPNSIESQRKFYESSLNDKSRLVLSIVDLETERHIGTCSLGSINWVHRNCEIAIIIGEIDFRKGPYVSDTMSLLLNIAFLRLNLLNITSHFISSNEATRAMHKVFRFNEVGKLKEYFWDRGKYSDMIIAMLKKEEWMRRNGIQDTE
jgi:RimJ/RimL family protein N-acetyltransferase